MITASRVGAGARERLYVSTTHTFDGDLDLIAIEHALNGQPVTLTPAERVEVARHLYEAGFTLRDIAQRIGSARDTITGWRDDGWPTPQPKPEEQPIDIGNARHGRPGYNRGCRCPVCRAAASESNRLYRERRAARKQEAA